MAFLQKNRELLERFRQGEAQALAEVYDHYVPKLIAKLRPGVRFWRQGEICFVHDARIQLEMEDIIQQTFLQVFEKGARSRYSGLNPYFHYLLSTARNVVLQSLRCREIPVDAADLADETSSPGSIALFDDPSWSIELREISDLIDKFQSRLKGLHQRIFDLRFVQKRSRIECMRHLNISEMQLRYREKRLLTRFLRYLKKHGYLE
jgi:RNA polymerase sigma factor (sigma-70 family)